MVPAPTTSYQPLLIASRNSLLENTAEAGDELGWIHRSTEMPMTYTFTIPAN